MLNKIKKWIDEHPVIVSFVVVGALLLIMYFIVIRPINSNRTTAAHIEAITATQSQTKEVKNNAGTVRQTQSDNDRRVRQAVKKAADDIPTDLAALVDMANTIIRSCNSNQ